MRLHTATAIQVRITNVLHVSVRLNGMLAQTDRQLAHYLSV